MSCVYDVPAISERANRITTGVARCPNLAKCRSACPDMIQDALPSPDFVGRRYRGLVIVGANPGVANTARHRVNDARMEQLMRRVAESGRTDDLDALHDHLAASMLDWRQLVNAEDRQAFAFDIEE